MAESRAPCSIPPSHQFPVFIGNHISHYRLLEKLGEGGMGVVYKAEDTRLGRVVALKLLAPDQTRTAQAVERMLREARLSSSLNHPHIATLHDVSLEGERPIVVFEYIPGGTLRDLLAARYAAGSPFTATELKRFGIQIASGLDHAHSHGVIHGDIKVDNVMLDGDGRLKVTDFGVGRFAGDDPSTTGGGGTLSYMSPEQIRGEPLDHRSDLFSLGVLLHELATGRLPFRGVHSSAVEYAILNEEPQRIDQVRNDLHASLDDIVQRLLQKNADDRFQRGAEVVVALESVPEDGATAKPAPRDFVTIAVLPFANKSADPEHEYLADGITEEIIWALTTVEGLRVVAPASSFTFKGSNSDVATIAGKLGVAHLIQGSVQSGGGRVRIIVHLVESASGFGLWSERYDRQATDLLEVQEEIARTIAQRLRLQFAGDDDRPLLRPHTRQPDAYATYLKGRFEQNRRTAESLRVALEHFRHAVAIDPEYALGYAGIADTLSLLSWYGGMAPVDTYPRAKIAAQRALDLDDSLAEVHASMALILHEYDWNRDEAEKEFRQAIALNPLYALAHHWYGLFLTRMGRFDEGEVQFREALTLDPLSSTVNIGFGVFLYAARRYAEGARQLAQTLALDRNHFPALYFLGMTELQRGNHAEAIERFQRANDLQDNLETLALLAHAHAVAGQREKAEDLLERIASRSPGRYVSHYHLAMVHTALDRHDQAFFHLDEGCRERSMRMLFLRVDPALDPLRSDPRYTDLLGRLALDC